MFENLAQKFQKAFSPFLKGQKITEESIQTAMREIRIALLDADVNFSIANRLISAIKEKALGEAVLKSVSAGEQFTKIVHDELEALMGSEERPLNLSKAPSVVLLCGLQGAGKTTQAAKLALHLKKQGKTLLLAACDRQRPAAIEQLEQLGKGIDVPVVSAPGEKSALKVAKGALKEAKEQNVDVLIVDTAGRLDIDETLMEELSAIKKALEPTEVLLVASAALGQKAAAMAKAFHESADITGVILTMLDSDARAGSALSILEVSKAPIKFEGIGEKPEDFQPFNPTSMADRILGMGDTINLVRRAEEHFDDENAEEMRRKMEKASFTFEDYLAQSNMIKKMGSIKGLLKMMPGMSGLGDIDLPEERLKQTEAIITSMTLKERRVKCEITFSRRKRIALGSGTSVEEVNRLLKGFKRMKDMMKKLPKNKLTEKMLGEKLWH